MSSIWTYSWCDTWNDLKIDPVFTTENVYPNYDQKWPKIRVFSTTIRRHDDTHILSTYCLTYPFKVNWRKVVVTCIWILNWLLLFDMQSSTKLELQQISISCIWYYLTFKALDIWWWRSRPPLHPNFSNHYDHSLKQNHVWVNFLKTLMQNSRCHTS